MPDKVDVDLLGPLLDSLRRHTPQRCQEGRASDPEPLTGPDDDEDSNDRAQR